MTKGWKRVPFYLDSPFSQYICMCKYWKQTCYWRISKSNFQNHFF